MFELSRSPFGLSLDPMRLPEELKMGALTLWVTMPPSSTGIRAACPDRRPAQCAPSNEVLLSLVQESRTAPPMKQESPVFTRRNK